MKGILISFLHLPSIVYDIEMMIRDRNFVAISPNFAVFMHSGVILKPCGPKVHVSPQGRRGGQGDGPCGLFSALKSLFSKNDLEKKIICITIFKKIEEKKLFFINYG